MSILKNTSQLRRELSPIVDYPVEAVAPAIEYEFIITLKDGSHTRHDPEDVTTHQDYVRVNGPRTREFTLYPMTSISWYGLQEKARIQSSEGDAA